MNFTEKDGKVDTIGGSVSTQLQNKNGADILMMNAGTIHDAAGQVSELTFLPFLGLGGYVVRGWSHMLAGYPKAGKTELLTRLCLSWAEERVLYLTEEPLQVWGARLEPLAHPKEHVTLGFALGAKPQEILKAVQRTEATVVVIDTVRNLLNILDETNNAEIARKLNPLIVAARKGGKTLIMAHHTNKSDAEHGKEITGGHAFLGVVDVALMLKFSEDGKKDSRRVISGLARVFPIERLLYEMAEDSTFMVLGSPDAVAFDEVKRRTLDALDDTLREVKEIRDMMDEPKPSITNLRRALKELVKDGLAECDCPDGGRGRMQRYRRALS